MPRKGAEPWVYDPLDVSLDTGLDDGHVLYFNATSGKFINVALSQYSVVVDSTYSNVITDANGNPILGPA